MLNEAGLRLWPLISYLVPVNVSGYFFLEPEPEPEAAVLMQLLWLACLFLGDCFFADVNFPGLSLVIEDIL